MNPIPPEAEALVLAVKKHLASKELGESCFDCEARATEEKKTSLCFACPSGELKAAYKVFRDRFPEDEALPDDPAHWLTIKEAQRLNVCRVCREPAGARERADRTMNSFWLGHGHEHAHEDCLSPEAHERMLRRIAETGPHRGD